MICDPGALQRMPLNTKNKKKQKQNTHTHKTRCNVYPSEPRFHDTALYGLFHLLIVEHQWHVLQVKTLQSMVTTLERNFPPKKNVTDRKQLHDHIDWKFSYLTYTSVLVLRTSWKTVTVNE